MLHEDIVKLAPAFAQDFDNYLRSNNYSQAPLPNYYDLPFEFQLGVFIKFLQENTIEIEPSSLSIEGLRDAITEGMKIYENITGHYS